MERYEIPKVEIPCQEFTDHTDSFFNIQDMNTILLTDMALVWFTTSILMGLN